MPHVLLDSNALDPLIGNPGAYEALRAAVDSGNLQILFTHVTVEEVAATTDLDQRVQLLLLLIDLGQLVPTGAIAVDVSRVGFSRLSDDEDSLEALRSHSVGHTRDALIAHTALTEQCYLITNDERLARRSREQHVEVLSTAELLLRCGFTLTTP